MINGIQMSANAFEQKQQHEITFKGVYVWEENL
jgi:hypothetical protein